MADIKAHAGGYFREKLTLSYFNHFMSGEKDAVIKIDKKKRF